MNTQKWRCPQCETFNTDSRCVICGYVQEKAVTENQKEKIKEPDDTVGAKEKEKTQNPPVQVYGNREEKSGKKKKKRTVLAVIFATVVFFVIVVCVVMGIFDKMSENSFSEDELDGIYGVRIEEWWSEEFTADNVPEDFFFLKKGWISQTCEDMDLDGKEEQVIVYLTPGETDFSTLAVDVYRGKRLLDKMIIFSPKKTFLTSDGDVQVDLVMNVLDNKEKVIGICYYCSSADQDEFQDGYEYYKLEQNNLELCLSVVNNGQGYRMSQTWSLWKNPENIESSEVVCDDFEKMDQKMDELLKPYGTGFWDGYYFNYKGLASIYKFIVVQGRTQNRMEAALVSDSLGEYIGEE